MIITCVSHGRRAEDARNLAAHLTKTRGQTVSVAAISGLTPGLTLTTALADLRRMTAMSKKAEIGFHHITLNSAQEWTSEQRDQAISRVLGELGAASHAWLLVEHGEKARATPDRTNRHWHLVLAHVGPEGRALDMRDSYMRLEAVARTCEYDFAEPMTPTRRPKAVARRLSKLGREDVRQALLKIQPEQLPRSAMSSAGRERAARSGVNLPAIRALIRAAWTTPDLDEALAPHGFRLAHGTRAGVFVVKTKDGTIAGALDRLAGVSRQEARLRVEAEMARQRKKTEGNAHDGLQQRQRARSRVAREDSAAPRAGDTGGSRDDTVTAQPDRRVASPRRIGEDRSETRYPSDDPAAARRRRLRAQIESQQADAAARRRRQRGRTSEADVLAAKAALAVALFGRALSPETIAALHFVDLSQRRATLRGGGWVRDAGDRLYASSADTAVISLMVDAAKAKGWQSVTLFGTPEFIEEARRQFEAAGIPVEQKDAPPAMAATPAKKIKDAETFFRDRLAATEQRLAKIREPLTPAPILARAERAEAEADDARWAARRPHDEALKKRNTAQHDLEKAGLLGRAKAKRALADAEAEYEKAKESYAAAREAAEGTKWRADCERRRQEDWERRSRKKTADAERQLLSERNFLAECMSTIQADELMARADIAMIEEATRRRLSLEEERSAAEDIEGSISSPPRSPF